MGKREKNYFIILLFWREKKIKYKYNREINRVMHVYVNSIVQIENVGLI